MASANFEIEAGRKLEVTITKVDIPNSTADLEFSSTVGSEDVVPPATRLLTLWAQGRIKSILRW